MKLVTYSVRGTTSIGVVVGNRVIDLPASDASLPRTMREFLQAGPQALAKAKAIDVQNAPAGRWPTCGWKRRCRTRRSFWPSA